MSLCGWVDIMLVRTDLPKGVLPPTHALFGTYSHYQSSRLLSPPGPSAGSLALQPSVVVQSSTRQRRQPQRGATLGSQEALSGCHWQWLSVVSTRQNSCKGSPPRSAQGVRDSHYSSRPQSESTSSFPFVCGHALRVSRPLIWLLVANRDALPRLPQFKPCSER